MWYSASERVSVAIYVTPTQYYKGVQGLSIYDLLHHVRGRKGSLIRQCYFDHLITTRDIEKS